jgi:hypothetical protein
MDREVEEELLVELTATATTPRDAVGWSCSRLAAYGTCLNRTRRGRAALITA